MKPNILLLMVDQMRGDCLGIGGHPDVKTPYLDSLAVQGDYFLNAYTACPSCIAARACMMTGLSPAHTGRVGYRDGVDWNYATTLPGELSKAGYDTKCVGKMHVHPLRNKLGFHDVTLHDGCLNYYRQADRPFYEQQTMVDDYFYWLKSELGVNADITDTGIDQNSWLARPWIYEEKYHPTNWVASETISHLRRRDRSKPFFLFSSFVRPHPPFDAPSCYFDMYRSMDLKMPVDDNWSGPPYSSVPGDMSDLRGRTYNGSDGIADPELLRQARIGYYACITHIDHQIGRILQALKQDGCMENTIILFTSDHGELLGDHHAYRKTLPYQGSVRIPLIFRIPGGNRGVLHTNLAGLQDILPTLVELAGGKVDEPIDGISLAPILGMSPDSVKQREYLHGEHSGGQQGNQFIVTERDKFIWFMESGREQYFDLIRDPEECHDLIHDPDKKARIDQLRSLLIEELSGREENYTDGHKLIPGQKQRNVLQHSIQN